jgi:hypothetical protein
LNCSADPGSSTEPDVIVLAGTYGLNNGNPGDDDNSSGDLDIFDSVVIRGDGAGTTVITSLDNDRVIDVLANTTVSISGVMLTGGQTQAGASGGPTASAGGDGEAGGGLRNAGTLTLDGVEVKGNKTGAGGDGGTNNGGFPGGAGGAGGGIFNTGTLTLSNSSVLDNVAGNGGQATDKLGAGGQGGPGGGIFNAGTVTISKSTVRNNTAGNGGRGGPSLMSPGGGGTGGDGGGIRNTGTLTVDGSTIAQNQAGTGGPGGPGDPDASSGSGGAGGGIFASAGTTNITGARIEQNSSGTGGTSGFVVNPGSSGGGGMGGGVLVSGGTLSIATSVLDSNSAGTGGGGASAAPGGDGGGIEVVGGTVGIDRSLLTGNHAGSGGTGTSGLSWGGWGGGIATRPTAQLTVTNSTFTGNVGGHAFTPSPRDGEAGALIHGGARTDLVNVTVAGNSASGNGVVGGVYASNDGLTLTNSVIASNSKVNCGTNLGTIADGGHNVSFPDATCPGLVADPKLGALADNGGPTKTMALGDGSAARDIATANCPATDQRGITRPQGVACDAGAFEVEVPPPPATTPTGGDQPAGSTPPPAGTAPDKTAPVVKLLLTKQKLRKALRKGYLCFFSDNELGNATASFGKFAKGRLKITRTGKQKLVLRFTKKAKKALRKKKRVRLKLVLTVKDAAGNTTRKTAKVTLKR